MDESVAALTLHIRERALAEPTKQQHISETHTDDRGSKPRGVGLTKKIISR